MMFHVGQKVICVNAKPRDFLTCSLVEGAVYTIAGFGIAPDEDVGIFLAEIASKGEFGFWRDRFRPAVSRPTSISFAHEILRRSSKQVDA